MGGQSVIPSLGTRGGRVARPSHRVPPSLLRSHGYGYEEEDRAEEDRRGQEAGGRQEDRQGVAEEEASRQAGQEGRQGFSEKEAGRQGLAQEEAGRQAGEEGCQEDDRPQGLVSVPASLAASAANSRQSRERPAAARTCSSERAGLLFARSSGVQGIACVQMRRRKNRSSRAATSGSLSRRPMRKARVISTCVA